MNKKELVAKLKELGLKGNVQEKKDVLEARLAEALAEEIIEDMDLPEMIEEAVEEAVEEVVETMFDIPKEKEFKAEKVFIGNHPITGEKIYK